MGTNVFTFNLITGLAMQWRLCSKLAPSVKSTAVACRNFIRLLDECQNSYKSVGFFQGRLVLRSLLATHFRHNEAVACGCSGRFTSSLKTEK